MILSAFQIGILTVFGISFLIILSYKFFYLIHFKRIIKQVAKPHTEPVSIIICSNNNGEALEKNLPYILDQNYPDFEVIVVDNGCQDDTEDIVKRLQHTYSRLRMTKIPLDDKFKHNKKLAQTIGIKAAKYERLIFTNPTCVPVDNMWLQHFVGSWKEGVHIAYSNLENKKGFYHNFVKNQILNQSLKAFCFANAGKTYLGNGNNMGYLKTDFFANKGFAKHAHYEAGYDHIMAYDLAKKKKCSLSIDSDSNTICKNTNSKSVLRTSLSHYYKSRKQLSKRIRLMIDLEEWARLLFIFSLPLTLIYTPFYWFTGIATLSFLLFSAYLLNLVIVHLKEENLFLSSYVYNTIVPFYKISYYIKSHIFSKRE